ncbi:hypothetical protein CBR_g851 [Chara braunii]|uniref:Myb-like domain-containing protein n=1 Tax=Chara braunii TaxID=69332 RepID=A0A388KCP9_CHABU|nr:hypothetical protein CBR_g851 [Chara braunii]|eukprot:GBG67723.1 hypothetical protein CBR_g851 [Chara braunii]
MARGRPYGESPEVDARSAGAGAPVGGQGTAVDMQWTVMPSPMPSRDDCRGMGENRSSGGAACNVDTYMHVEEGFGNDMSSGNTVPVHHPSRDSDVDNGYGGQGTSPQADEGLEPLHANREQEGCDGRQKPQLSQGETTPSEEGGSQGAARARKRGDWAHLDTMTLIRAKGNRHVARALNSEDIGNGRTSKKAWEEIAKVLAAAGMRKTWLECRTRWRNVWATYKQVTALHRGSGAQSYWRMTSAERQEKGFNFILRKDWFDLLEVYFWNDRSVHPSGCEDPGSRFEEGHNCSPFGAPAERTASPATAPSEGADAAASDSAHTEGARDSVPSLSYKKTQTAQNARDKSMKELGGWMREQTGALKHHTNTTLQCAELTVSVIDRQSATAAAVQRDCAQLIAEKMEFGWKVIADLVRES